MYMGRDKNLSESLRYIYEHLGVETFQNEKIVYSLLTDLIPKEKIRASCVLSWNGRRNKSWNEENSQRKISIR